MNELRESIAKKWRKLETSPRPLGKIHYDSNFMQLYAIHVILSAFRSPCSSMNKIWNFIKIRWFEFEQVNIRASWLIEFSFLVDRR